MSQHDMNIENQGFPAFRSDLNNALAALASTSAGSSEPTTKFAQQLWYDSSSNLLKMRNTDNDAWITLAYFDQTNDEWEVRSAVIQAVDAAGVVIKTDDGTTRLTIADSGAITTQGDLTVGGDLDVSSGTVKLDGSYPVGNGNSALGANALDSLTSGQYNVGIGLDAGTAITSGINNIAIGTNTLKTQTDGVDCIAIGRNSLRDNTANNNVAVGSYALQTNTTGANNVAIGVNALESNSSGLHDIAIGGGALESNTSGYNNIAIGGGSLQSNLSGLNNTAVGRTTLQNNTADNNVAIGSGALERNTTGDLNTAVGFEALHLNLTGSQNTALGRFAGDSISSGSFNTFLGSNSGSSVSSGSYNVILGRHNGNQNGLDITTSNNNIVLSDGSGNPRMFYDGASNNHWIISNDNSASVYWPSAASVSGDNAISLNGNTGSGNGWLGVTGSDVLLYLNRNTGDGTMVVFYSAGGLEGNISVSGTTVSYNGGHLSRWSRLADDSKDTSIVKGTVMTNLDAMVEWGDEDNEQLNKMAVSSVEGDANVAGVFVNWDEDDDWNDMNIAMTGDMVIRIAQGTTVQRGDLLMSAGDGTAKPQDDDIVRSKTIAKVTSTHVSHTYDDGSYLVPCVLMAC